MLQIVDSRDKAIWVAAQTTSILKFKVRMMKYVKDRSSGWSSIFRPVRFGSVSGPAAAAGPRMRTRIAGRNDGFNFR